MQQCSAPGLQRYMKAGVEYFLPLIPFSATAALEGWGVWRGGRKRANSSSIDPLGSRAVSKQGRQTPRPKKLTAHAVHSQMGMLPCHSTPFRLTSWVPQVSSALFKLFACVFSQLQLVPWRHLTPPTPLSQFEGGRCVAKEVLPECSVIQRSNTPPGNFY